MQFSTAFLATAFVAFVSTANAISVDFYKTKDATCGGSASVQNRNVKCNSCVDPPGDWQGIKVFDIGAGQRVSMHNQDSCTSKSSVGQWYGPVCARAGATAVRSVWVACSGQRIAFDNSTSEVAEEDRATLVSLD